MVSLRDSLLLAARAAKANLLPGLLLQAIMVIFFLAYLFHTGTQNFLARVAVTKEEAGFVFAFVSYVFAGAFLPELLRVVFFQRGKVTRANFFSFLTAAPLWGFVGILVDLLYRLQGVWFGMGNAWHNVLPKVLVDQFLFSPLLCNPMIVGYFLLRDSAYRLSVLPEFFRLRFFLERVFPVQVAAWCIWIPGVVLVYLMPPLLQVPVAVAIQCFWVLVFTTVKSGSGSETPG